MIIVNPISMRYLVFLFCLFSYQTFALSADTLNGFDHKRSGEEINYFSHMHQFAKTALLTRATGAMPISWESPVYKGSDSLVTYEFLMGHSTGTSSSDRQFDVSLNGKFRFTITTFMKKKGAYQLTGSSKDQCSYTFIQEEYDINGDAFGKLCITVPSSLVDQQAVFTINGQHQDSRDWLMIFMYQRGLKMIAEPTNLITRRENKRQLNLYIDNPYPDSSSLRVKTHDGYTELNLRHGYNALRIPAYSRKLMGHDSLRVIVNRTDTLSEIVELNPIRDFTFHIIHHSHNDIGYSHLQTDVENIQNNNILAAIRWIKQHEPSLQQPIWHIESLWAVENFLRIASTDDVAAFKEAVQNGQIVLSANYANILTGLCQPEELKWSLEYAKQLEQRFGFRILNAMITDIPGITYSGLKSYVDNDIPYLSLGPNYVETQPDKGDRVGDVIKQQGDQIFYWKPNRASEKKLLVWTAGKGYSFFHGINESGKQAGWEQRISQYCDELEHAHYPYNIIQLRYTKNSDNGPVDTDLVSFVEHWNDTYSVPQLTISSINTLYAEFERKYAKSIPVRYGEISPYWEDGAYSTAKEEMDNRDIVRKTIAMESFAKQQKRYEANKELFYRLHRSVVMFHEHTWGAWCSISDPELPFTTQQWDIKKQFLDSAIFYYKKLSKLLSYTYKAPLEISSSSKKMVTDFVVDSLHGGLKQLIVAGQNIVPASSSLRFFELIYVLGINPSTWSKASQVKMMLNENNNEKKVVRLTANLPSMKNLTITYTLWKREGRLTCACAFDKIAEKEKESLHMAMPFAMHHPTIRYGTDGHMSNYDSDQLPGSNHEFVCVEDQMTITSESLKATVRCPKLALYEIGSIIDETKINGSKVWKKSGNNTSDIFLYIFNNYWHTNYKAYQAGHIEFETSLCIDGLDDKAIR